MTMLDIKIAIFQSGRPQYAIAQEVGVHETALSRFLHGRGKLTPVQLAKLAAILGLPDECPSDPAGLAVTPAIRCPPGDPGVDQSRRACAADTREVLSRAVQSARWARHSGREPRPARSWEFGSREPAHRAWLRL